MNTKHIITKPCVHIYNGHQFMYVYNIEACIHSSYSYLIVDVYLSSLVQQRLDHFE